MVRHGNTVWNGTGRYQGFSDVPLNEEGRRQAGKLALRLAREEITAVFSSDLQRACHTAETIAAAPGLGVAARPQLRELNFGHCEGLTFDQISERFPGSISIWRGVDCANPFSGGESIRQLADRVGIFLNEISAQASDAKVTVVAHSGPVAVMICLLLGVGIDHWWQFRTANASLSIVDTFETGAVLSLLNDAHHLEEKA